MRHYIEKVEGEENGVGFVSGDLKARKPKQRVTYRVDPMHHIIHRSVEGLHLQ